MTTVEDRYSKIFPSALISQPTGPLISIHKLIMHADKRENLKVSTYQSVPFVFIYF